jgi:hypothetical protein
MVKGYGNNDLAKTVVSVVLLACSKRKGSMMMMTMI